MEIESKNKKNFTSLDNPLITDPNISALAFKVYAYIEMHINLKHKNKKGVLVPWDFAAERIRMCMKESIRPIRNALTELETLGLLEREKQNNGRVIYYLMPHPKSTQGLLDATRPTNKKSQPTDSVRTNMVGINKTNNKKTNNVLKKKNIKKKKIPLYISHIPKVWRTNKKFQEAWTLFCQHRVENTKAWGETQAITVINKMYKKNSLTIRGAIECLEMAIEKGWKSVFPENVIDDPRNVDSDRSKKNRRKVRKSNA